MTDPLTPEPAPPWVRLDLIVAPETQALLRDAIPVAAELVRVVGPLCDQITPAYEAFTADPWSDEETAAVARRHSGFDILVDLILLAESLIAQVRGSTEGDVVAEHAAALRERYADLLR